MASTRRRPRALPVRRCVSNRIVCAAGLKCPLHCRRAAPFELLTWLREKSNPFGPPSFLLARDQRRRASKSLRVAEMDRRRT